MYFYLQSYFRSECHEECDKFLEINFSVPILIDTLNYTL